MADLDALEKLADEVLAAESGTDIQRMADADQAFYEFSDVATIKALIAELKEARGLISLVINDAFDCQEDSCLVSHRIIADARAFLAKAQGGE